MIHLTVNPDTRAVIISTLRAQWASLNTTRNSLWDMADFANEAVVSAKCNAIGAVRDAVMDNRAITVDQLALVSEVLGFTPAHDVRGA